MFALTRLEVRKLVAQRRAWAAFLVVVLINGLFAMGFYLRNRRSGAKSVPGLPERLMGEFMNANEYTQTILAPSMFMLFPMVLSILGAYVLAGEIESGSLRLVLCRAVNRWEVIAAKFVALCGYSAAMLFSLGLVSYGVSSCLFKRSGDMLIFGPMFMLKRGLTVHAAADALPRILLSYTLALPMLMSVCAMALMFAMVTRHFTSAAILTATVYFCSYIVSGIPLLSAIHRFMPTRYLPFFRYALESEIPWATVRSHGFWTLCYTAAFLAVAAALFGLRDY